MPIIPNKLHFIWVGTELQPRYAENIANWCLQNPRYEIHLWTEIANLESYMRMLKGQILNKLFWNEDRSFDIEEGSASYKLTTEKDSISYVVYVDSITVLEPISDPAYLAEELSAWKNYGAASDIIRVWVLYQYGGIYMDTDTFKVSAPIPLNINAPKSVLFGMSPNEPCIGFVNGVMASSKGSPKLRELAVFMQDKYAADYSEIRPRKNWTYHSGVYTVPPELNAKLQQLTEEREHFRKAAESYREYEQKRMFESDSEDMDDSDVEEMEYWHLKAKGHRKRFKRVIFNRTIEVTGPQRVRDWVAREEGAQWKSIPKERRGGLNIPELQANEGLLLAYSFEIQSGYTPRIEFHGQWMK